MAEATLTFDREQHRYFLGERELPSVTHILHAEGLIDTTWFTEHGRNTGDDVACVTEHFDLGDEDTVHAILTERPELQGYLDAWDKFLGDSQLEMLHIERPMCDPIRGYAGTADRAGIWRRRRAIIDIKRYPKQWWHAVQLAAYVELHGGSLHWARLHVQLKENGKYKLQEFTDPTGFATWAAALALYWAKFNNGVYREHSTNNNCAT